MNTSAELQDQARRIMDFARLGLHIPPHVAVAIAHGLLMHAEHCAQTEAELASIKREADQRHLVALRAANVVWLDDEREERALLRRVML